MLELLSKLREETGAKNKQVREQGFIPAILYGYKINNLNLSVNYMDFEKTYKKAGESTLIKLKIKGDKKEERTVLIYDVAKDPVTGKFIHIDFNQVRMDQKTTVEVSLVFIGKSEAVERDRGVLVKSIQAVEVEALPQDFPNEIEVDISVLKTFDDSICIKNLKVSDKVKLIADPEEVVASVMPSRTDEELEKLEEAPEEKVDEVEVEEKGKDKEAPIQDRDPDQSVGKQKKPFDSKEE